MVLDDKINTKSVKEENLGFFNKSINFMKTQSGMSICFISFGVSGYLAYSYLKRKHIMMEYHGHFNSPQNMLNQRLTSHYVKDAAARFGLSFLFFTFLQIAVKFKLMGLTFEEGFKQMTQMNEAKSLNEDLEEEDYINNEYRGSDINQAIKRRENVNKYLSR
jgi:hypothetical protein